MSRMPAFPPGPCAETDFDLWFPEKWQSAAPAVNLCRSCESRVPCLAWSINTGSWEGVFGGLDEGDRREAARLHARGVPLEDLIAEADARFYAESARVLTVKERKQAWDRRKRAENRTATALAAEGSGQVAA